jgi:predicted amidohydrolase
MNFIGSKGELIGTYAKANLFGDEKINFTPGNEFNVYDTDLGKVGLLICYDLEFPEPARRLGCRGADIIIANAANMGPYYDIHEHFAKSRAMENVVFVVYCNFTGSDNRFTYVGGSGLYSPDGNIEFGPSKRFDGLIYAEVDPARIETIDPNMHYLDYISDEERELYLR